MKILFTGGGTAGHILPIIAIVREIRKIYPDGDFKFYYLGPKDNFSSILLSQENIGVNTVFAGKIRRYFNFFSFFQNIFDILLKIPAGIILAFFHIFFLAPDIVFSKGGYGSFPTVFSAWILRVPIFLHEGDVAPGLTNRFLSRFAAEIFVSFPVKKIEYLPLKKMVSVGTPIRKEILEGSFEEAKEIFNISGEKQIVLILGGSQGAQRINDMLLQILPNLLNDFEIIHQCGEKNFRQVQAEANVMINKDLEKYYHLFPFLKEAKLKNAYAAAALVVSRAGANSISEISALGKPSILIPLAEAAQDHQVKNAYAYAEDGACLVMEEKNLTPHFFVEKVKFLLFRPDELQKMRKAALEFSRPQAGRIIAEYLIEYLK